MLQHRIFSFIILLLIVIILEEIIILTKFEINSQPNNIAKSIVNKSPSVSKSIEIQLQPSTQIYETPPLYIQRGQILQKGIDKPILLKGALSDYFRGGGFSERTTKMDIQEQINYTNKLKPYGINIVGFYISSPAYLKERLSELDEYISFARKSGIYVFLMPVARDFDPMMQRVEGPSVVRRGTYEELYQLIDLLAFRYKNYPDVLYGFGAEPSGTPNYSPFEAFDAWNKKQKELAQIVRSHNSNAILLITSPAIGYYSNNNPFSLDNIIYVSGGYAAYNAEGASSHPDVTEQRRVWIIEGLPDKFPGLIGEFGGFSSGDFSTPLDLEITQKILEDIHKNNLSYTAYKLASTSERDTLSLFDMKGNLTKKGQLYVKYFSTK